jgi:AcrR family transcriptional regulator
MTTPEPPEDVDWLEEVRQATAAKAAATRAEGVWRATIQAAIRKGVRVADIAEAAGISAARVYQIRDNAR